MTTTLQLCSLTLEEVRLFMLAHREVVVHQVAGEQPRSIQLTESYLAGGAALVRGEGPSHFFAQSVPINLNGARHILDRLAGVVAKPELTTLNGLAA